MKTDDGEIIRPPAARRREADANGKDVRRCRGVGEHYDIEVDYEHEHRFAEHEHELAYEENAVAQDWRTD